MNKKLKHIIIIGMILLGGIGCVQLQSVTINSQPSPEERKAKIAAESDKLVFLAFNFNNDFLEETPKKLLDQCKDGKIRGIISKFETVHYFIFTRYVVKASGYCTK